MRFDEVWQHFRKLVGQRFHTLDQRKPFTLTEVGQNNLTVRVEETGRSRPIQRAHFEEAWSRLTGSGRLSRSEIHREISLFNPAYVATLLAQAPGVQYRVSPIVLTIGGSGHTPPLPSRMPAPPPDEPPDEDRPGSEEVEESVADRLAEHGRRLGFEVVKEWRTDLGNRIDLVWARQMAPNFPAVGNDNLLPVVGFEIESSWRSRKHIKGDIFNLQDLSPSLGVIVLCCGPNDSQQEIESLRATARRYIEKVGLRILVWSDGDVDKLCGHAQETA